jgi:hypothetical protein
MENADAPHTPFANPDPFAQSDHENSNSSRSNANPEDINEAQGPKSERRKTIVPGDDGAMAIDAPGDKESQSDKDSTKDLDKMATFKSKMKHAADKIHLDSIKATGVSRLFNPTRVKMHIRIRSDSDEEFSDSGKMMDLLWRARDNRKGRNSIAVPYSGTPVPEVSAMKKVKESVREIGKTLLEMFTTFPYWDMAFWSGWSYTVYANSQSALITLPVCDFETPSRYVGISELQKYLEWISNFRIIRTAIYFSLE